MLVINLILLATAVIVVAIEGYQVVFVTWNILPLLAVAVLSEFLLSSGGGQWQQLAQSKRLRLIGLVGGVVSVTLFTHIFWILGGDEAANGSSDGGAKFVIAPLYAFLGGVAGFLLAQFVGRVFLRIDEPSDAQPGSANDTTE